tara:strand:- start:7105 stop:7620 length:516 start_codon:yes stop_codon:yes gene_type:complete
VLPAGVVSRQRIGSAAGCRFGIVAGRFYEAIVGSLVEAAVQTLLDAGAAEEDVTVLWVGGAVELPLLCQQLARRGQAEGRPFDALLAMGCVIRGGTPHFDYVCDMVSQGVNRVALDEQIPISFGILTCDTGEQAFARSGLPTTEAKVKQNKGIEAAEAALEMVSLLKQLRE